MTPFRPILRSLLRAPAFTLAMIATLALGIGASVSIFSVMDQTVLRKPYPHWERLAMFGSDTPHYGFMPNSYTVQVLPCMTQGRSFEAFALSDSGRERLGTGTETLGVSFCRVNPDFFPVMASRAALGRLFTAADFVPGAEEVMILHPLFWQEAFGGDPAIVGRLVMFEERSFRIVGVLSQDFTAPMISGDLYLPLVLRLDLANPFGQSFNAMVRLRPGCTLAQANAEVSVLAAAKDAIPRFLARFKDHPLYLKALGECDRRMQFNQMHGVFLGAVAFLYAIACFNAINLMLVRLTARRRELGIRLALGGSRTSILGVLGLEALVLSLLSGLGGLLVARLLMPAMLFILAPSLRRGETVLSLDARALFFALGFSLLTSLLVIWIPAWRISSLDPQDALKQGGAVLGEAPGLRRLREALVVLGAAMALVLLTGTGLMTRSVQRLMKADRGFDPSGKMAMWLEVPKPLRGSEVRHLLAQRLKERMMSLPGIKGAAIASGLPFGSDVVKNLKKQDGTVLWAGPNPVSPDYREKLGLKQLKGRWLPEHAEGPSGVVVFNQAMSKAWFGLEDPIGRNFAAEGGNWEVIGLVSDARVSLRGNAQPQYYYPYWQDGDRSDALSLLLDLSRKGDANLVQTLRRAIHEVEPQLGVRPAVDMEEAALQQIAKERFVLMVLQAISAVALLLAALGLFSVMAYVVSRRMNEFGIRLALGATPRQVFISLLGRGLALTGAGVAMGLGCSWALTRFISSLLFETSPLDITVYLSASAVLLATAVLASWFPARRAAEVEPAGLLRSE